MYQLVWIYSFLLCTALPAIAAPARVMLAADGHTDFVIEQPAEASEAESFAAGELAGYIRQISGANLSVIKSVAPGHPRIVFERGKFLNLELPPDGYAIAIQQNDVFLVADTDRARLFAVYDVLERLGCRWLAPKYSFYNGESEFVPRAKDLALEIENGMVVRRPDFAIRKLDIEEGLSHNTANLKQLIEWAPKLRYNTLMFPRDYGGRGRVTWDQWREAIAPKAKTRGLIIEVGGHGYENFINAGMNAGKLFEQHPDWFGQDEDGKRSKSQKRVFCTSNPPAVSFFIAGVIDYLKSHPEIEVFQIWPPDGAEWCTCAACEALGEPQDRQAMLVNQVQARLDRDRSGVRLEIIAYSKALRPPNKTGLDERILVDYCPINQSFEVPISDPSSSRNREYAVAVTAWREQFKGEIGLYSYYRKCAWKSLPALIPHYMQEDLRFYRSLPLQAVMIYGEPGDWGTYELNHYALGKLTWKVDANVDEIVREFCAGRYGPENAKATAAALQTLGDTVRTFGSLPFTSLKSPAQIEQAQKKLSEILASLPQKEQPAFRRLRLMFEYAQRDLQLQQARADNAPETQIRRQVESLVKFLDDHKTEGIFIVSTRDDIVRVLKRYGVSGSR